MTENGRIPENGLTPKQEALIELLLTGVNVSAACRQLKLAERTARRWLKAPHFKTAYRQARQDIFDERLSMLREGINTAIKTLAESMDPKKTKSEFVRMSAAAKWLDTSIEVYKAAELEREIAELKTAIKASEQWLA
jgi:hypothetical protein